MGKVGRLVGAIRRDGLRNALHHAGVRALNKVGLYMDLRCLALESAAGAPGMPAGVEHGYLDGERLLGFAADPANGMSPAFVREALFRGDRCFGVVDGGALASYAWYSTRPTAVTSELAIRFDPAYVYMYKGFTREEHRGRRLYGAGMALALRLAQASGARGLIAWVASNNFASLRACYRLGYVDIGRVLVAGVLGRTWIRNGRGCERYGVSVERPPTREAMRALTLSPAARRRQTPLELPPMLSVMSTQTVSLATAPPPPAPSPAPVEGAGAAREAA